MNKEYPANIKEDALRGRGAHTSPEMNSTDRKNPMSNFACFNLVRVYISVFKEKLKNPWRAFSEMTSFPRWPPFCQIFHMSIMVDPNMQV